MKKALLILSLLAISGLAFADTCGRFIDAGNKQGQKLNQLFKEQNILSNELNQLEQKGASKEAVCKKAIELRKNVLISAINLNKGRAIWIEAYISCSGSDSEGAKDRADKMDDDFSDQSDTFTNLDKGLVQKCGAESLTSILLNL